jgi:hypothetical protein
LASSLSDEQRERLVSSLVGTQSITEGDLKLIEIVKARKDARVIDFLIEKLHGMEENPPEIANTRVDYLWDMVDVDRNSDVAEQFMNAPSALDSGGESDENQTNQGTANDAIEQTRKTKEAIEARSAALKKFLATVESMRRSQSGQTH